jgi:hypothetical protein
MNIIVRAKQETLEAKIWELNALKIRAGSSVIAAKNERLYAIGKERALIEKSTKYYRTIRNTRDKLFQSMEDTAIAGS